MRTFHVAMLLLPALGACTDAGDEIVLENAAGKADGAASARVELTSGHASETLRFTCDEGFLDRCNIVLDITPDFPFRDAARAYLKGLGTESQLDLVRVKVLTPDGEIAPLVYVTNEGDFVRDSIMARTQWVGSTASRYLVPSEETELEVNSWAKGEYRLVLERTSLPGDLPDLRAFGVMVSWY